MESKLLKGKVLRNMHRAEMFAIGGLTRDTTERKGREKTVKYVALVPWLKRQPELKASVEVWLKHKGEHRKPRRIRKGSNPVSPSKLRTAHELLAKKRAWEEQKKNERQEAAS